ncbi:hypothetical protein GCM10010393_25400 [Streptomyces gobitricini]|uniref:Uncharacterized protein n=1 Tax=Streptomyces gobitricini TaxID=68211 RepID=A0ABN3LY23_9ACTN
MSSYGFMAFVKERNCAAGYGCGVVSSKQAVAAALMDNVTATVPLVIVALATVVCATAVVGVGVRSAVVNRAGGSRGATTPFPGGLRARATGCGRGVVCCRRVNAWRCDAAVPDARRAATAADGPHAGGATIRRVVSSRGVEV